MTEVIPVELKDRYDLLVEYRDACINSIKPDATERWISRVPRISESQEQVLIERIALAEQRAEAADAENAALKEQVKRLTAPVTDEEWGKHTKGVIDGESIPDEFMFRDDINALLAEREVEPPLATCSVVQHSLPPRGNVYHT